MIYKKLREQIRSYLDSYVANNRTRTDLLQAVDKLSETGFHLGHSLSFPTLQELALVMLYYGSPFTIQQICDLKIHDLHLLSGGVAVSSGAEDGKNRDYQLNPEIAAILRSLAERIELNQGVQGSQGIQGSQIVQGVSSKGEKNSVSGQTSSMGGYLFRHPNGCRISEDEIFALVRDYPNHDTHRKIGFHYPVLRKEDFPVLPTPLRLNADPRFTGRGVTLAFIDSGFYPHPDLVRPHKRILAYKDIGNPDAHRTDFEKPTHNAWHGMQTSVSACGNGFLSNGLFKGIAWNSNLALLKARGSRGTSETNIARCIEWCIKKKDIYNIRIINISLGMDEMITLRESLIDAAAEDAVQAGIIVVVAVGNDPNEPICPPASAPSVITVGGLNDMNSMSINDYQMYWSTYGKTIDGIMKPEIIAPGIWVAAPILPGTDLYEMAQVLWKSREIKDDGLRDFLVSAGDVPWINQELLDRNSSDIRGRLEDIIKGQKIIHPHYQHVDGTSFSAPIVASVAAQMLEANPALRPYQVKEILMKTAVRSPDFPPEKQGHGIVSPRDAVRCAMAGRFCPVSEGRLETPFVRNSKVIFRYENIKAKSVSVAGSFNDWNPASSEMERDEKGIFSLTQDFPFPGTFSYKFVVDGKWIADPNNFTRDHDGFGGLNSLVTVYTASTTPALLEMVDADLEKGRPGEVENSRRKEILSRLDSVLQLPMIGRSDSVRDFYLNRMKRALRRFSLIRPDQGSAMMALYNNGYLVRTPELTLGLDVVSTRHVWGLNWEIPDEMIDSIVEMMDVLFISHRNPDHFDYEIATAMVRAGKVVVAHTTIADLLPRGALGYGPGEKHTLYSADGRNMGLTIETFEGVKHVRGEFTRDLLLFRLTDRDGTSLVFTGDADYSDSELIDRTREWHSPEKPINIQNPEAVQADVSSSDSATTESTVADSAMTGSAVADSAAMGSTAADSPVPGSATEEKPGFPADSSNGSSVDSSADTVADAAGADAPADAATDIGKTVAVEPGAAVETDAADADKDASSRFGVDLLIVKGGQVRKDTAASQSMRKLVASARPKMVFAAHLEEIGRSVKHGRDTYAKAFDTMSELDIPFHIMTWGEILRATRDDAEIQD
ncbi:MAG: hypothetical protein CVV64_14130 [Candidatus Wallbacteria bacterium HGW-Wallbacteria-1]|jgi:serine protease AprX|uniref:Uncharacterized protein n=1 Tax=Candidatus Wallbacteria bacterium HGW-Wallbacteria-1 TaxID=2013854 RepID=A0A2N1PMH5_9BACT|nr:MAG: hypothetical protein CVV64_14130 [Candidatus Wallbacteria bacterium HGW-Wallbacteria-1]